MGFCFAPTSVRDNCLHEKRVIVFFEPNREPNSPNAGLSNVLKHVFHAIGRSFVKVLVQQIRGSQAAGPSVTDNGIQDIQTDNVTFNNTTLST